MTLLGKSCVKQSLGSEEGKVGSLEQRGVTHEGIEI